MKAIAGLLALISAASAGLFYFRIQSPKAARLWIPKMIAAAVAPFLTVAGALAAVLGLLSRARLSMLLGILGAGVSANYVAAVAAPHDGFEKAFGPDWESGIPDELRPRLPASRWSVRLPASPEPRWLRDVVYWRLAGDERPLTCDIWQPAEHVPSSGLAVIYSHGGAWHVGNKDFGTRPFFRHLAGQGHVVMDIDYRLAPDVDLTEMLGDVKRAIAWLKDNADRYGIFPERIVLAGGSAGAHLSLLAAYTAGNPQLTPDELRAVDTTVRGVVSYYGPTDLRAVYEFTGASALDVYDQVLGKTYRKALFSLADTLFGSEWGDREMPASRDEMMANLLGGRPFEVPEMYDLASPISHVRPDSPPTLLFHGEHDFMVPVESARRLRRKMEAMEAQVVYVEFPQTDHAFDLFLPPYSAATLAAIYDIDRFLALLASPEDNLRPAAT